MTKVIIAMSGGVDSAVAAQLLKTDLSALGGGYDVIGVFMRMHKNSNPKDARIVAKKIGIDFKILDVRKEFKKRVINYTTKELKSGNTPNPCVECNKNIKFKFLIDAAKKLKADYIATGHYAKIKLVNLKPIRYSLITARDKQKDQSYFLWQLNQKQLSKILFPLGDYTKEQVRELAKRFKLSVLNKPESQDICFSMPLRRFQVKRGNIISINGQTIGKHKGLMFYTIGQRKGIEIAGGPYYVIRKDFKNNALIVSKDEKDLMKKELIMKNTNWINKPIKFPLKCGVKIRSMAKISPCVVYKLQTINYKLFFSSPQRAVTSGQSAALYLGNELIGGGVIQ